MNMQQIWEQLCNKNALLRVNSTVVEFESQNLKRLLEQVYEQGVKQGRLAEQNKELGKPSFDPFGGLFK